MRKKIHHSYWTCNEDSNTSNQTCKQGWGGPSSLVSLPSRIAHLWQGDLEDQINDTKYNIWHQNLVQVFGRGPETFPHLTGSEGGQFFFVAFKKQTRRHWVWTEIALGAETETPWAWIWTDTSHGHWWKQSFHSTPALLPLASNRQKSLHEINVEWGVVWAPMGPRYLVSEARSQQWRLGTLALVGTSPSCGILPVVCVVENDPSCCHPSTTPQRSVTIRVPLRTPEPGQLPEKEKLCLLFMVTCSLVS